MTVFKAETLMVQSTIDTCIELQIRKRPITNFLRFDVGAGHARINWTQRFREKKIRALAPARHRPRPNVSQRESYDLPKSAQIEVSGFRG